MKKKLYVVNCYLDPSGARTIRLTKNNAIDILSS
jgi:hypothetical protein